MDTFFKNSEQIVKIETKVLILVSIETLSIYRDQLDNTVYFIYCIDKTG